MAEPQIPDDWHPATYAVDEPNKVVWKQGGYAVAMGLKGKHSTLIPGYEIRLCTTDELERMRRPAEPKAEADAKTIQKGFWGVSLWLLEFIRANGKLLLAGSSGFGAAWGLFKSGTFGGMIAGAFVFHCLLCGLITVPVWIWLIASSLWDGFKGVIRWLNRFLNESD